MLKRADHIFSRSQTEAVESEAPFKRAPQCPAIFSIDHPFMIALSYIPPKIANINLTFYGTARKLILTVHIKE